MDHKTFLRGLSPDLRVRLTQQTNAPAHLRLTFHFGLILTLAIYTAMLTSLLFTPLLFWVWLLPLFLGQMALRVFLLAEHADCPHSDNMFENTRTTLITQLLRWVTWNASFHVDHHAMPTVPFHNLPDLHRLMKAELRQTSAGYAEFTRSFLAQRDMAARHPAE